MNRTWTPFTPFAKQDEIIAVTPNLARRAGLQAWGRSFKLGTAGYRDLLDPDDLHNLRVPFNSLTVAIMLEARARVAEQEGLRALHVGGEVRPHTQELIDLAARIYAAHGITVHLRPPEHRTTPIWLSSFGVFFDELDGGENFTASHSQSYKGGWKPMDAAGGQLLEMAPRIAERVRELAEAAGSRGLEIPLTGADAPLIRRDFDPVEPYVDVLRQVVPAELLAEVTRAAGRGFRAAFCTEGGSMAATGRRIFAALGWPVGEAGGGEPIAFTHEREDSNYHGIGIVDGVNHGVDPGKWQVYKNVGAQEILRRKQADVFFIWDPDGDRFNMVTVAPAGLAGPATAAGLEVDPLDRDRCLVFFKPNQIYFLLTALKIEALHKAGSLDRYDWIVATTFPTSRSILELARTFNERQRGRLKTFQVPVGFKHFAALTRSLELQLAPVGSDPVETAATDVTGRKTVFGPAPRMLIMAEESGGAALGPAVEMISRQDRRRALAAKEKDAMQVGVLALTLAARLHNAESSFTAWYLELLDRYRIGHRFYERRDVTLYDESLQGAARETAQAQGNARKDATVAFFASLEKQEPAAASRLLQAKLGRDIRLPAVSRIFRAGDGTLIEFDGQWFELRASGTDAVLRYYMEGRDRQRVSDLNAALAQLEIERAEP